MAMIFLLIILEVAFCTFCTFSDTEVEEMVLLSNFIVDKCNHDKPLEILVLSIGSPLDLVAVLTM